MSDEWRAIPEWEDRYEVSDAGQVRSFRSGITLKTTTHKAGGYPMVGLKRPGQRLMMTVHKAVMLAFVGPRAEAMEVRHLDGNPTNNRRDNLAYGTRSENILDSVRHGTHTCATKTHCLRGHDFTQDNTYLTPDGRRVCRRCKAATQQRYRAKKRQTA